MGYSTSSLAAYTKLSPNNSGQRSHSIDRITPHCVVGQCSAEGLVGQQIPEGRVQDPGKREKVRGYRSRPLCVRQHGES